MSLPPVAESRWSRRFAQGYDKAFAEVERTFLGPLRARLVGQLPGRIVEIGAGTGANVPHYRAAERVDLVEPLGSMRAQLHRRLEGREGREGREGGIPMTAVDGRAEQLPFDDGSVDAVVSTLVLCSVADVDLALAEVRRVLVPGGVFAFLEHSRGRGVKRAVQAAITPVTMRICGNCHHNRDLAGAIHGSGFAGVTPLSVPAPLGIRLLPEWPLVAGHARNGG